MKLILTMMIGILMAACAADMGRQGDMFNTKDVFSRHEKNLNLQ
jgi:outer membrane biogenesis lipoprotein LolB